MKLEMPGCLDFYMEFIRLSLSEKSSSIQRCKSAEKCFFVTVTTIGTVWLSLGYHCETETRVSASNGEIIPCRNIKTFSKYISTQKRNGLYGGIGHENDAAKEIRREE